MSPHIEFYMLLNEVDKALGCFNSYSFCGLKGCT